MEKPRKFLEGLGVNVAIVGVILGLVLLTTIVQWMNIGALRIFAFAIALSPIWLPTILFLLFFDMWKLYIRTHFYARLGRVTLEILLPEEILKSPLAMELALGHLYQTASVDNHIQTYWDGKHPPTFSLELVSIGGTVRFFINLPPQKYKNIIEAQLYSQYPGIEIRQLPIDYAAEIDGELTDFDVFGMHFGLRKDSVYPIKTYIDYGLDKDPKEELKIDPITQMLDMLGSIGPNERIWIQILITAHRGETFKTGNLRKSSDWKDAIKAEINKISGRGSDRLGPAELESQPRLTEGERNVIKALERGYSKIPFNVAIRAIYAAKKGFFLPGERIGAIITSWFQYNDNMLNQFGLRWRTDFDWNWWQDPKGRRKHAMKKREINEYKRRVYDNQSQDDKQFIMTVEELATIFHFPGKVARTPTLGRIPSARVEAPPNLPTGKP